MTGQVKCDLLIQMIAYYRCLHGQIWLYIYKTTALQYL